jgi:hypothetical protein
VEGNNAVMPSALTSRRAASAHCDVAVIGAGPYGLSAGVHRNPAGIRGRAFGEPLEFCANKIGEGMLLRSPMASKLSDPDGAFTLEAYETASKKKPCAPVPLPTFVEYGKSFRHPLGSHLDQRAVPRVDWDRSSFILTLADAVVMQFDGNGSHILDPRTGFKPFNFGAFNVHLFRS